MRVWILMAVMLVAAALALHRRTTEPVSTRAVRQSVAVPAAERVESSPEPLPLVSSPPVSNADFAIDRASALFDIAEVAMHAMHDEQSCLAGTGKNLQAKKIAIHRWVDDAGITHFSDQAPLSGAGNYRRIEVDGLPPVVVAATGYDVNLPEFLAQRAVADTQAIEQVLRSSLGVTGDPGFALNIEFIAAADAYARRVGDPVMANSQGAYSSRDRTIRVHLQKHKETNFIILRHEITHALIHERIGNLPIAINEGLAGFFERIEVSGMGARIVLGGTRGSLVEAQVSAGGKDELVDLLAREGMAFYGAGQEKRYLQAFALVALLMQHAEGKSALSAVLAAQRAEPCRPVDVGVILDRSYPGSLSALAADWARWLRDPPPSVLAF